MFLMAALQDRQISRHFEAQQGEVELGSLVLSEP